MWERMVLYSINTPKWTRTPFHHVCFDWTMLGVCSPEWFSMEHSRHCPSPISRDTQMNPAFLFFSAPSWLPSCLLELLSHCHPGMTKALAHRELSPRLFASLLHILWCSAPALGKPKALPSPIVSITSTWTDKRGSSFLLCSCCWLWNVLFISPRLLLLFDPVGPYPFPQNLVPFFRWFTRLPAPFFPIVDLPKALIGTCFFFHTKASNTVTKCWHWRFPYGRWATVNPLLTRWHPIFPASSIFSWARLHRLYCGEYSLLSDKTFVHHYLIIIFLKN